MSSGFSEKQGFVGVAQCRGLTKSPSGRSYHCFVFAPRLSRYFGKRRKDLRFQKYYIHKYIHNLYLNSNFSVVTLYS